MSGRDRLEPGAASLELAAHRVGPHDVLAYHRPHPRGPGSGDRLVVRATRAGALAFALADATGHGAAGDELWRAGAARLDAVWDVLDDAAGPEGLRRFVGALNSALVELDEEGGTARPAHAALCAGLLAPEGSLDLVVMGYGVHPLVVTDAGPWRDATEPHLGIKLGWLATEAWSDTAGAYVAHALGGVRRLVVLTDGFLGDDFADPNATLAEVRALEQACACSPTLRQAAELVARRPHGEDDATLVAVELNRRAPG